MELDIPPTISIEFTKELIDGITDKWSQPVQIKFVQIEDTYTMIFRTPKYQET